jgi:hypothetical protein
MYTWLQGLTTARDDVKTHPYLCHPALSGEYDENCECEASKPPLEAVGRVLKTSDYLPTAAPSAQGTAINPWAVLSSVPVSIA